MDTVVVIHMKGDNGGGAELMKKPKRKSAFLPKPGESSTSPEGHGPDRRRRNQTSRKPLVIAYDETKGIFAYDTYGWTCWHTDIRPKSNRFDPVRMGENFADGKNSIIGCAYDSHIFGLNVSDGSVKWKINLEKDDEIVKKLVQGEKYALLFCEPKTRHHYPTSNKVEQERQEETDQRVRAIRLDDGKESLNFKDCQEILAASEDYVLIGRQGNRSAKVLDLKSGKTVRQIVFGAHPPNAVTASKKTVLYSVPQNRRYVREDEEQVTMDVGKPISSSPDGLLKTLGKIAGKKLNEYRNQTATLLLPKTSAKISSVDCATGKMQSALIESEVGGMIESICLAPDEGLLATATRYRDERFGNSKDRYSVKLYKNAGDSKYSQLWSTQVEEPILDIGFNERNNNNLLIVSTHTKKRDQSGTRFGTYPNKQVTNRITAYDTCSGNAVWEHSCSPQHTASVTYKKTDAPLTRISSEGHVFVNDPEAGLCMLDPDNGKMMTQILVGKDSQNLGRKFNYVSTSIKQVAVRKNYRK